MALYRKKPVVVEAVQWTGHNFDVCLKFCPTIERAASTTSGDLVVPTMEGEMLAREGWWIIKGVKGEFYPCEPDIFEQTHEKVS